MKCLLLSIRTFAGQRDISFKHIATEILEIAEQEFRMWRDIFLLGRETTVGNKYYGKNNLLFEKENERRPR